MRLSLKWAALAAVSMLASTASETWAAGGAQPQRTQLTQGWVIGVHRGNGQPGFLVRTPGVNNQAALAANPNGVVPAAQNAQGFSSDPAPDSRPRKA
jgi:hypothetical protein